MFGLFASTIVLIASCVFTLHTHKVRGAIKEVAVFGNTADLCCHKVLLELQPISLTEKFHDVILDVYLRKR